MTNMDRSVQLKQSMGGSLSSIFDCAASFYRQKRDCAGFSATVHESQVPSAGGIARVPESRRSRCEPPSHHFHLSAPETQVGRVSERQHKIPASVMLFVAQNLRPRLPLH